MTWEGHEENYNVFRWYGAGLGRYTQADPITRSTINTFTYAVDRPASVIDPNGLWGVTHRENVVRNLHPEAICDSVIACSQVQVHVDCNCRCGGGDDIAAEPNIRITGTIYVNPFFRSGAVSRIDPNVHDFASAVNREYYYHIMRALLDGPIPGWMDELEQRRFRSVGDCKHECEATRQLS